jgi:glutathione S-transferase
MIWTISGELEDCLSSARYRKADVPVGPITPVGSKESWSPNTLKTKYAIAHKGLNKSDYELKWVSYPDVRDLLKSKGVPAFEGGTKLQEYTLPAIDHDDKTIMDSLKIALYLDEQFPDTPKLLPDGILPLYRFFQTYTSKHVSGPVFPLLLPRVIDFLDDRGSEYFKRTREATFGPISESINQDKAKVDACWKDATDGLKMLNQMLDDNPGGPFILGKQRSYPDLHILSILEWWKQSGEEFYERAVSIAPNLKTLYDACSDIRD